MKNGCEILCPLMISLYHLYYFQRQMTTKTQRSGTLAHGCNLDISWCAHILLSFDIRNLTFNQEAPQVGDTWHDLALENQRH
ncbi:uncharacterized protein LOC124891521 isoform X1 [Capsicum annuum]|uniref:uncharacterized protein LOC107871025 n=1 Tax=Capsicum annuum TaxID=4072 RepID=UPI001FB10C89|nr:uncharacterized protein LOC107871025 [Capsicum annuum]XP_047255970.1 uncharacterized protein LOC107871025 [Capsicum annuum]XP_047255971.1 uncharacterized protein LOC107871025 [Capsicum annuum]XP_047259199.1 uncharacterized protein LOC124891521 isoform X1 [Capsicum annuum]XP_047259200.1 uncharacterized protein LOC124891521 isoform X1 [Capsicum annuum]